MSWLSRRNAWVAFLPVFLPWPVKAAAQGWREVSLLGVGTFGRPGVAGVGAGLAWRDRGRTRVGAAFVIGPGSANSIGGRAELVYHFLLDPARRRGTALYAGGGASVVAAGDGKLRPFLMVVVGAEAAPGSRSGSFVELGAGGGIRAAIGMRWRKQNAPRR